MKGNILLSFNFHVKLMICIFVFYNLHPDFIINRGKFFFMPGLQYLVPY